MRSTREDMPCAWAEETGVVVLYTFEDTGGSAHLSLEER
jgi:hypothetical protein